MEEIKVMPKPDWVTWDDIHELLIKAHQKNIEKGMVMKVPQMAPEMLKDRLGEKGQCFVAFSNNKLVGTTSVRFYQGHSWYNRGQLVAHSMLSAILPKYQGIGITEDLNRLRDSYIHEIGAKMIHADTPENNLIVRKNAKRNGFVDVGFYAPKSDHYSVVFVKWLDGCPFSDKYISRKFELSKRLTKIQYKKGRVERFCVLSLLCRLVRKILDV